MLVIVIVLVIVLVCMLLQVKRAKSRVEDLAVTQASLNALRRLTLSSTHPPPHHFHSTYCLSRFVGENPGSGWLEWCGKAMYLVTPPPWVLTFSVALCCGGR